MHGFCFCWIWKISRTWTFSLRLSSSVSRLDVRSLRPMPPPSWNSNAICAICVPTNNCICGAFLFTNVVRRMWSLLKGFLMSRNNENHKRFLTKPLVSIEIYGSETMRGVDCEAREWRVVRNWLWMYTIQIIVEILFVVLVFQHALADLFGFPVSARAVRCASRPSGEMFRRAVGCKSNFNSKGIDSTNCFFVWCGLF